MSKQDDARKVWEEDGDLELMQSYFQRMNPGEEQKERIKQLALDKLAQVNTQDVESERPVNKFRALRWSWNWRVIAPVAGVLVLAYAGFSWYLYGNGSLDQRQGANSIAYYDMSQQAPPEKSKTGSREATSGGVAPSAPSAETPLASPAQQYFDSSKEPVKDTADRGVSPADSQLSRKITQTLNVTLEVQRIDVSIKTINEEVTRLGGYIVESHQGGEGPNAYGALTIKVPAESFEAFKGDIPGWGKVLMQDGRANDITNQYYDAETQLRHWEAEEKRYMDILKEAKNVNEILQVEGALANIRSQIEQLKGQLKLWDNQVAYSTIGINLVQPNTLKPEVSNPWQPISWNDTWKAIKGAILKSISMAWNALNFLLIGIGYILPYLIVGTLSWFGYRYWRKYKR